MTHSPAPRLSVITVHLDDFDALEATRRSLKPLLAGEGVEWIVQDGGSRAGSDTEAAILANARRDARQFHAEPDTGIYDGMNRAAARAAGDWLLFLNAGDVLHPGLDPGDFLSMLSADVGMLWLGCHDRGRDGLTYPRKARGPGAAWLGMPVSHQAILFRRQALPDPVYDARFRFAGDYHLVCRLLRDGVAVQPVDQPLVVFDLEGRSSGNKAAALAEERQVRGEVLGINALANGGIFAAKWLAWHINSRLPRLRAWWRQRV